MYETFIQHIDMGIKIDRNIISEQISNSVFLATTNDNNHYQKDKNGKDKEDNF